MRLTLSPKLMSSGSVSRPPYLLHFLGVEPFLYLGVCCSDGSSPVSSRLIIASYVAQVVKPQRFLRSIFRNTLPRGNSIFVRGTCTCNGGDLRRIEFILNRSVNGTSSTFSRALVTCGIKWSKGSHYWGIPVVLYRRPGAHTARPENRPYWVSKALHCNFVSPSCLVLFPGILPVANFYPRVGVFVRIYPGCK